MLSQEIIAQTIPRFNVRALFSTERDMQLFADREQEIEELEKVIDHEFNVLLLGERGTWKDFNSKLSRLQNRQPKGQDSSASKRNTLPNKFTN